MKVYYNSACPVCKAGIEGQMKKGASCEIQWADVHRNNELVSEVHAELESVRERLHVVDENQKLHVGFDAESYIACVHIFNLLKVVLLISGGTSDGLYLYSGDLNEVTVSICLTSERSLIVG